MLEILKDNDQGDFSNSQSPNIQLPSKKYRYAYINGHHGTHNDLLYVSKQLGFDFAEFNQRIIHTWGQTKNKANDLNYNMLGDFFCKSFDVIIVGDVNTDARFLL